MASVLSSSALPPPFAYHGHPSMHGAKCAYLSSPCSCPTFCVLSILVNSLLTALVALYACKRNRVCVVELNTRALSYPYPLLSHPLLIHPFTLSIGLRATHTLEPRGHALV